MTITLKLAPELKAKLLRQAASLGKQPEELALNAIEEQLAGDDSAANDLTPQEWVADFRRWAAGHRRLPIEADDSREGIYAGRGE
jgi:hypothetical protein